MSFILLNHIGYRLLWAPWWRSIHVFIFAFFVKIINCLLTLLLEDLLVDLLEDVFTYQALSVEDWRARLRELSLAGYWCSFQNLLILLSYRSFSFSFHFLNHHSTFLQNICSIFLQDQACVTILLPLDAKMLITFLTSRLRRGLAPCGVQLWLFSRRNRT